MKEKKGWEAVNQLDTVKKPQWVRCLWKNTEDSQVKEEIKDFASVWRFFSLSPSLTSANNSSRVSIHFICFSWNFFSLHSQVSHDFAINFNPEDDECEGKEELFVRALFHRWCCRQPLQPILHRSSQWIFTITSNKTHTHTHTDHFTFFPRIPRLADCLRQLH